MQLVALKTFDNYFSANIISSKLQEDGIACFLKDEYSATINPLYNNVIGGIKLMVNINDVAVASDFLLQYEEAYLRTISCPQCEAKEITSVTAILEKSIFQKMIAKIFKDKNIQTEKYYLCQNCEWTNKILPENL